MSIRCCRGFSLVELILAIIIMGVGLAGLMSVMPLHIRTSADPLLMQQAQSIADGMLNEISSKAFSNPPAGFTGAATQANRASFDDVFDYHGYTSTGAYAIAGVAAIPGLTAYDVSVTVTGTALGAGALQAAATTHSWLITVTVTYPGGGSLSASGYRLNYA